MPRPKYLRPHSAITSSAASTLNDPNWIECHLVTDLGSNLLGGEGGDWITWKVVRSCWTDRDREWRHRTAANWTLWSPHSVNPVTTWSINWSVSMILLRMSSSLAPNDANAFWQGIILSITFSFEWNWMNYPESGLFQILNFFGAGRSVFFNRLDSKLLHRRVISSFSQK